VWFRPQTGQVGLSLRTSQSRQSRAELTASVIAFPLPLLVRRPRIYVDSGAIPNRLDHAPSLLRLSPGSGQSSESRKLRDNYPSWGPLNGGSKDSAYGGVAPSGTATRPCDVVKAAKMVRRESFLGSPGLPRTGRGGSVSTRGR